MTKEKLKNEAREYLAEHSEYSEVFEETFIAVDTLTAMVDFAEPREKRIADLENANAELKKRNAELKGMYAHSAREAGTYKQFLEAKEKENAELKEELTKKADTNHSLVEQMADLESENAELKKELVEKGQHLDLTEKEWGKDLVQMYHFKTLYTKQTDQLTKAKEIIKELVRVEYADFTNGDYSNELSKVLEQAEQFLKETE